MDCGGLQEFGEILIVNRINVDLVGVVGRLLCRRAFTI